MTWLKGSGYVEFGDYLMNPNREPGERGLSIEDKIGRHTDLLTNLIELLINKGVITTGEVDELCGAYHWNKDFTLTRDYAEAKKETSK